MKVYIVDNQISGHHKIYIEALSNIDFVEDVSTSTSFENSKMKVFRYFKDRFSFLNSIKKKLISDKNAEKKVLHFLYLDNLYIVPLGLIMKRINAVKIGTIHHIPNNSLKRILLKSNCRYFNRIIVHSEVLENKLREMGICNVETIEYPSFYNYENMDKFYLRERLGINADQLVISALGGTRYDKGIDILLESMRLIDDNLKKKIILNIAGKEDFFKSEYINSILSDEDISVRLELGYISDYDFEKNVIISDVMVFPYREIFSGNSGPMTEALRNRIPIVACNNENFNHYITKFSAGELFTQESIADLGLVLNKILSNLRNGVYYQNHSMEELKEIFSVREFIEKHNDLYKTL